MNNAKVKHIFAIKQFLIVPGLKRKGKRGYKVDINHSSDAEYHFDPEGVLILLEVDN